MNIRVVKTETRRVLQAVIMMSTLIMVTSTFAADTVRQGSFKGLNRHVTQGTVTLVKGAEGFVIELGDDFDFDGAPDPKVAFGKDGEFDPATLIEALRSNTGAQSYAVPATINPDEFNEIYIWCEKFSVGLGVATIR